MIEKKTTAYHGCPSKRHLNAQSYYSACTWGQCHTFAAIQLRLQGHFHYKPLSPGARDSLGGKSLFGLKFLISVLTSEVKFLF